MKNVYIISHSHWDREWYLPYEAHRMQLIQLFDDFFHVLDTDPDYHSFHLDGQTNPVEDYLEIRPEMEGRVREAIQAGKLKIGPFYILQDAYLTSSESNVRNALIGMKDCRKWGATPPQVGYFPDTFGIMGQAPQMIRQWGFDAAAYGRGVKPLGFKKSGQVQGAVDTFSGAEDGAAANEPTEKSLRFTSPYSEMHWEGADGSRVLGVLFANWYSNGNEIPAEPEAAKIFWDQKLADAALYASTDHLLMMNGCDHQPLQKDLSAAIKLANDLYPEHEFIHSDLDTYLKAVQKDLPAEVATVKGELKSQETDGWYTLANTASSRIYLKQHNTRVSRLLENVAEPLAAMAFEEDYPHDQLDYAWKTLLQNHPHDSICGCSVDEVHREMVTRFAKAEEVGRYVADKAAKSLAGRIDTSSFPEDSRPFIVFNTSGHPKTGLVELEVEWRRIPFSEQLPPASYDALKAEGVPPLKVVDPQGKAIPFEWAGTDVRFGYDLPEDKFRQPFYATYVKIRLMMDQMPGMSWQSFALVKGVAAASQGTATHDSLENEFLRVAVGEDGTLTVTQKETGRVYDGLLCFENTGDIANEYVYRQPVGDRAIFSTDFKTEVFLVAAHELYGELELVTKMAIPISADSLLEQEQRAMVWFTGRQAGRSQELGVLELRTRVRLEKGSRQLKFETVFDNQMKDHRLRVLFPTGIHADTHEADSIFEAVTRPNQVSAQWKNPTNPQQQHAFVNLHDEAHGVTVANFGLNEYEVVGDTLALTLLRATGELGDWGYFPTPEAQCLGPSTVAYAISFHGADDKLATYHEAMDFQIPFTTVQVPAQKGPLPGYHQFFQVSGSSFRLTAFKRGEKCGKIITRGYNLTSAEAPFSLELGSFQPKVCNLLEEETGDLAELVLRPAEIVTYKWTNEEH